jgi:hypothetical protein
MHGQALFVQQRVPVVHDPFGDWQQVPVRGLHLLALFLVGAEVDTPDPQLKRDQVTALMKRPS